MALNPTTYSFPHISQKYYRSHTLEHLHISMQKFARCLHNSEELFFHIKNLDAFYVHSISPWRTILFLNNFKWILIYCRVYSVGEKGILRITLHHYQLLETIILELFKFAHLHHYFRVIMNNIEWMNKFELSITKLKVKIL